MKLVKGFKGDSGNDDWQEGELIDVSFVPAQPGWFAVCGKDSFRYEPFVMSAVVAWRVETLRYRDLVTTSTNPIGCGSDFDDLLALLRPDGGVEPWGWDRPNVTFESLADFTAAWRAKTQPKA